MAAFGHVAALNHPAQLLEVDTARREPPTSAQYDFLTALDGALSPDRTLSDGLGSTANRARGDQRTRAAEPSVSNWCRLQKTGRLVPCERDAHKRLWYHCH